MEDRKGQNHIQELCLTNAKLDNYADYNAMLKGAFNRNHNQAGWP